MSSLDIGQRNQAVLLFGGPYSNVDALASLLTWARDQGIPPELMVSTGDTVAYCGAPNETTDLMRETGIVSVAGNCEIQIAQGALDCGCGFDEGSACDILSVGWFSYASKTLSAVNRAWMGRCPSIVTFTHYDKRVAVIHGGLSDVSRFIWETSAHDVFEHEIDLVIKTVGPVDMIIAGHSGIAFEKRIGDVLWVNAGVIGMPEHNGHASTRFAVLENGDVTFHALNYDVDRAVYRMQEVGLTQGYHDSLRRGYWPSEDVLPEELRVFAKG